MANPLDIIVDTAQITAVSNPQRTTVNPAAQQIALAVQNTQGQTAVLPTITATEPVITTNIIKSTVSDNISGGTANQLIVQTAKDTTGYITAPQVADRYVYWDGQSISWAAVDYNNLANKPTLFSGAYADLTGLPTLFSGVYADLTGKPTIPAAQVNSDWNATTGLAQILNKPTLATVATSGSYTNLSDQPTLATGTIKTVAVSGQTSVVLALDGTLTLVAGNAITITTNNTTKAITIANNRNVLTATAGSTYTVDCTLYNTWRLTLTASTASAISVASGKNPPSGQEYEMRLYITYATSSSVTWSLTGVIWPNGVAPTQTGTAGKTDVFAFTTLDGGTSWYGIVIGQNW